MDNPKLSIFLPTIRPFYLSNFYNSILGACKNYSFQVVLCGPFEPPEEILSKGNVKFIKSYAHPTKCAQIAALNCDGELIFHTTDDVLFLENTIDNAIDQFYAENADVISMRYTESVDHLEKNEYPLSYWKVSGWISAPNIDPNWNINAHFLMKKSLFELYGGFDCEFGYLTYAAGSLLLFIQSSNGRVLDSKTNVSTADWSGGSKGAEHLPIQHVQEGPDRQLFLRIWALGEKCAPVITNYLDYPDIWDRRFDANDLPKSYEEMISKRKNS